MFFYTFATEISINLLLINYLFHYAIKPNKYKSKIIFYMNKFILYTITAICCISCSSNDFRKGTFDLTNQNAS